MTYQGIELSSYLKELYSKYLEVADLKHSDKAFEYFIVDAFIEFYKKENNFNRTEEETYINLNYLRKHKTLFTKQNKYGYRYLMFSTEEELFIMLYEKGNKKNITLTVLSVKYFKPLENKLNEIQRI